MITKKVTYISDEGFEFVFEPIEDTLTIKKTKIGFEARYLIKDEYMDDTPRNWDNLGTMICFHSRYTLGDKHNYRDNEDFIYCLAQDILKDKSIDEIDNMTTEKLLEEIKGKIIILPLFLYDHSGITISTSPFSCRWDSGQVGYIYITKEDLKKEGITKTRARKVLKQEVKTYDEYLAGEVYMIVKETYTKDKKQIDYDCVGGYYGYEDSLKALKTEV